jgi:hypothetical protein
MRTPDAVPARSGETVIFIESLLLNVLSGSWLHWS